MSGAHPHVNTSGHRHKCQHNCLPSTLSPPSPLSVSHSRSSECNGAHQENGSDFQSMYFNGWGQRSEGEGFILSEFGFLISRLHCGIPLPSLTLSTSDTKTLGGSKLLNFGLSCYFKLAYLTFAHETVHAISRVK